MNKLSDAPTGRLTSCLCVGRKKVRSLIKKTFILYYQYRISEDILMGMYRGQLKTLSNQAYEN